MADEIRADYEQLGQLASRFENQSQLVQETLQKLKGSMDPLKDEGWIGRGSDAFFAEMEGELLPAVQRLHNILGQASQVTKAIVNTMQHAEEEASARFRNRS